MTLMELQKKLGEQVELLTEKNTPFATRKALADVAMTVSSLAKQMINNADVILRTEKLVADGKMKESSIVKMIDKADEQSKME